MNNKSIKEKIIASIIKAQKEGFTLVTEYWGSSDKKCACAIGCVYVAEGDAISDDAKDAAQLLGVSDRWIISFIDGFDSNGAASSSHEPEAWMMGQEIKQTNCPITYGEFMDDAKGNNNED